MAIKEQIEVFTCEKCGKHYTTEESANNCCKDYYCEKCGKLAPRYHTLCSKCKAKKDFDNAKKYTYDEYMKEFPDNMLVLGDDNYFSDIDELYDYLADSDPEGYFPEYCYGTVREPVEVNINSAIENAEENAYEDFSFDGKGVEELETYVRNWNEKYGSYGFVKNKDVIILLDPREEH